MPGAAQRARALVVDLRGVQVDVQPGRLVEELPRGEGACAPVGAERAELGVEVGMGAEVLGGK